MAVTALYVHVPFCAQKCRYCDFDSRSFAPCDLSAALDAYFEQLYARLDAFGKMCIRDRRMANAADELALADRYDDVVVNDDLDRATDELVRVLDMHERI